MLGLGPAAPDPFKFYSRTVASLGRIAIDQNIIAVATEEKILTNQFGMADWIGSEGGVILALPNLIASPAGQHSLRRPAGRRRQRPGHHPNTGHFDGLRRR